MPGTGDAFDFAVLADSGVSDVAFSADESLIYAAMRNGDVNVYNVATRQKIATWHVGTELGAISVSPDGSFLLTTERQGPANTAKLYRVDTTSGAAVAVTMPGQAFRDVEIVDGDTAILTGASSSGSQTLYNLSTGQFSALAGAVYYSGWGTVMTEDKHLTLLAEPGISNGPLFIFDDRTNAIVAFGDNYQSINTSGFNWGSQAISVAANRVLQFVYHNTVNVFDLQLKYITTVAIQGSADGIVFDPSGRYVYFYEIGAGLLSKYHVASWTKVDQFAVGTSTWHNDLGYGSQLLISADGTRITIVDSDRDIGKLRIVDTTIRNERFDGTAAADAFAGGKGDDIYRVDNDGDTVTELPHEGEDTVETLLAAYTLGANVERLTGLSASGQALTGNAAANIITGGTGDDVIDGGGGNDVIDGGAGGDIMSGAGGDDVYHVGSAGDAVVEAAGEGLDEVRTGLSSYVLPANVENLTATNSGAHDFRGNAGNNAITGGGGNDFFRLQDGGNDNASGGDGHDAFYLGAALTAADSVDGGSGRDQLALQGNYALTLGSISGVEDLILLSGTDARFGDAGTGLYGYSLTSIDANVAAGATLLVDGTMLVAGESFTFNGAAETNGTFLLSGGKGVDILTGGAGSDGFFFRDGTFWGTGDKVTGGASDQIGFRGDFTGAAKVVMGADQITGVTTLVMMSGTDIRFGPIVAPTRFDIEMHDGNVASGKTFTVDGSLLSAGETMRIDASDETNGAYRLFGGAGADTLIGGAGSDRLRGNGGGDTLTGNGGADRFVYGSAAESTGSGFDLLTDVKSAEDFLDLDVTVSGWNATVTSGQLRAASFDADLAAALDGALDPGKAILFDPTGGDMAGRHFLVVDGNGDGAYTAGADYVFELGAGAIVDTSGAGFFV